MERKLLKKLNLWAETLFQNQGFIKPLLAKKTRSWECISDPKQQCWVKDMSSVLELSSVFIHQVGVKEMSSSERICISCRQHGWEKAKRAVLRQVQNPGRRCLLPQVGCGQVWQVHLQVEAPGIWRCCSLYDHGHDHLEINLKFQGTYMNVSRLLLAGPQLCTGYLMHLFLSLSGHCN